MTSPDERVSRSLRRVAPVLGVLLLSVTYTVGAFGAFPIWDDGWLWLLLEEQGTEAIVPSHPERPVGMLIWQALAPSSEALWRNAFVAQALLWPVLAFLSARLWRRYVPELADFSAVVGLVAIAPFVTKVQMVTANVALTSLLTVVVAYTALLLVGRFPRQSGPRSWVSLGAGLALLALAVLIQEYAVPVALAGAVLLATERPLEAGSRGFIRPLGAGVAVAVTAGLAYRAYVGLASFKSSAAREELDPASFLDAGTFLKVAPSILASALWNGLLGGFLRSTGAAFGELRAAPWVLLWGLLIGGLLAWGTRDSVGRWPSWRLAVRLLLAVVAALVPVVVGGEVPWDPGDGMSSRFGLPALPVLAALVVLLIIGYLPGRVRWVPILVLGFSAGLVAAAEATTATRERELVGRMGRCLQPIVEANERTTMAVLRLPPRSLGPRRQWELAARLAFEYPEGLSRRLWAERFFNEALRTWGRRIDCRGRKSVRYSVRKLKRRDSLGQLLWLEEQSGGSILIESYCRRDMAPPAFQTTCAAEVGE